MRGTVTLPNSLGKKTNIAVLTEEEHLDKCKLADMLVNKEVLD